MKTETFEKDKQNPLYKRAIPFIEKLLYHGIPLSAIETNDFNSNTRPSVYVVREYGRNGGGRFKKYVTWYLNKRTLKLAIDFYFSNNPKQYHGHIC